MPGGGTLRVMRDKMAGYTKFLQLVKTMKMVTLAKYKQTLPRIQWRDETLHMGAKAFPASAGLADLIVVMSTNRGSCGALNTNVKAYVDAAIKDNAETQLLTIGKKANESYSKTLSKNFVRGLTNDGKQATSFLLGSYIAEHIKQIDFKRASIVYNRFVSAGSQRLAAYEVQSFEEWCAWVDSSTGADSSPEDAQFRLAIQEKGEQFKQDYYDFQLAMRCTNAAAENELSEYAARIVAVENQVTNIQGLLDETEYIYNKTRKETITAELLEIIGTMTAMTAGAGKEVELTKFYKA